MSKERAPVTHRIKDLREARGWSQEQLGTAVKLSKYTISRIEGGAQKLDLPTAQKIADALQAPLAAVLGIVQPSSGGGFAEDVAPYTALPSDPSLGPNEYRYTVGTDACENAGVRRGDVVVVDDSAKAVAAIEPLDVVVVSYTHPDIPDTSVLMLRQFVPPGLLITNARANARSIDIAREPARILAVIRSVRRPSRNGHS